MKISELQNGDIIATANKGFLPKGIRYFMRMYSRKFYGYEPEWVYNHTMTVVSTTNGIIKVAEAVARGYIVRELEWSDDWIHEPVVIRPVFPFTSVELYRLRKQALNFAFKNIEYEVTNFIWWMVYIVSKGRVDWSPKSSEKKLFCFETSALLWNAARPGYFEDVSKTTTVDMIWNSGNTTLLLEED